MTSKFIGRKKELNALNNLYKKEEFQNIVVYGRRRVGKTELCLKFLENKRGLYFLCKKESISEQAQRLVDKFSKQNNIFPKKVLSFEEAFEFIVEKIENKQFVIVLDEFPYLIEENRKIVSNFQYLIDEILKTSKVFLILLGSSISIMENEVLGYKSPLYGRRTGQLKVLPFSISDLCEFFPDKNLEEIIKIYSVLDSIPAYLNKFDVKKGVFENIFANLLSKEEYLFEEVDFLLNCEVRKPKNYKKILEAVSKGKNRLSEISSEVGISANILTNYLDTLLNLHILRKVYPVTEKKELSRNSIYEFEDNFFKFWFKFVYPNKELIEEGKSNFVIDLIKKEFNIYVSFVFEEFCRKFLRQFFVFQKLGAFWKKGVEIDILGLNDLKKEILFGECKWKDNVDASRILPKLKEKSSNILYFGADKNEKFAVFGKSFRFKDISDVDLFDLKDMENIIRRKL